MNCECISKSHSYVRWELVAYTEMPTAHNTRLGFRAAAQGLHSDVGPWEEICQMAYVQSDITGVPQYPQLMSLQYL